MKIEPFLVEEWMDRYETGAKYNIAETCVDPICLDELFEITGVDREQALSVMSAHRLNYGDIVGLPALREGICRLYRTLLPEQIITTHGAAGASHHVFYSLIEPGDEVVTLLPTYQQLYSIPTSFHADVKVLWLEREGHYHPDLQALRKLVTRKTKMLCINNPNNPTGALLTEAELSEIVDIARTAGCWLLSDEVYRHLTQADAYSPSAVDMYEKAISISSMSKVFSLAGLRLGWIAAKDEGARRAFLSHRDYDLISCSGLDEYAASIALRDPEKLFCRNRHIVRKNLVILDSFIREQPHLSYVKPAAGTTALLHYDFDIQSRKFCKDLYDAEGAFLTPGDCFGLERCMRIGYACDQVTLKSGLAALGRFTSKLHRKA